MPSAKSTSKDLLKLEHERSAFSALESTVLVCKKEMLPEFPRYQSDGKLVTTSVPTSNVLGKVKDFLGVMAESNKKLQDNAVKNSDEYDIEVLNGNENEYIEMDLLLGVSDLHTPEAVAAAESAISGPHTIVDFAAASSDSDTEDSDSSSDDDDDDDDDDDEDTDNDDWVQTSSRKLQRSCSSGGDQAKKRLKIQEL